MAVLLPGAYLHLRETRPPPVAALRAAGVPMAVATDCNPGTSPLASLTTAMNLACTLFGLTPAEALAGATRHAARALGLADRGQLAVGLRADLCLWNAEHPAELRRGSVAVPRSPRASWPEPSTMHRPADLTLWHGRADAEEGPRALRWHQVIRPLADGDAPGLALLGFACDAGVARNQGRAGAAEGPAALRRALANLAWHGDRAGLGRRRRGGGGGGAGGRAGASSARR